MAQSDGWQALGRNRRLVTDLMYFCRHIPLFPLERICDLSTVATLRERAEPRISWAAVFLKAYGMLSAAVPELRQTYFRWPWPHIYQHPESVGMLAVSRQTDAGERLCWGRFIGPESQTLVTLEHELGQYKTEPVEAVFRRQVRLSKFPLPARRFAWWIGLNTSGRKRAKRFGTFGLSSVAGQGAINRFHPSCLTTSLSYGPLDREGRAPVTVICDHRVLDGAPLARALAKLETILQGPVADELAALASSRQAA